MKYLTGLALIAFVGLVFSAPEAPVEENSQADVNSDSSLLKQILRDVTLVKKNTTELAAGLEANTKATKAEKGMCKSAMRSEVGLIEERAGTSIHNRFAETLVEYEQLYHTYTPCDIGNVFKRVNDYMKTENTCVGDAFRANTLGLSVTFHAGKPEITLECRAAACFECLAASSCNLDTLLSAITDQKLVKEGMLVPARNYLGNHQLSFDGKANFVQFNRFYEYTPAFTFEGWFAWEPEEGFNMEGATARIFDFFSADDRRGDARGSVGTSKTSNGGVMRADGEFRKADETDLLVQGSGAVASSGSEVADEDGDFSLNFRKHHVVSAQWISGMSLSPGSYRPASITDKSIPTPPEIVPIRVALDNVELVGDRPLEHGRWQHVAVTVSKTPDASEETDCCWDLTLYVDGDVVGRKAQIPLSQIRPDRMLYVVDKNFLGRNQNGSPEGFFKGYMDEIRLWRVARTAAQINGYMHRPVSAIDEDLIAYYRFDELLHSPRVQDMSQNRHDGTLGKKYTPETFPKRVSIRPEVLPEMGA